MGGVRVQYDLRQILVAVNVMIMNLPEVVITPVNTKFDESGNLTIEITTAFLKEFIDSMADFSTILKHDVLI
jgi:chromate reductase